MKCSFSYTNRFSRMRLKPLVCYPVFWPSAEADGNGFDLSQPETQNSLALADVLLNRKHHHKLKGTNAVLTLKTGSVCVQAKSAPFSVSTRRGKPLDRADEVTPA